MGTNYYWRRRFDSADMRALLEEIKSGRYNDAEERVCYKVHIGKRSCGWKFLWNANRFKHFSQSRKSLYEFLKSGRIFDEYGKEYTFDKFINEEVGKCMYEGYDLKTYEENDNNNPPHTYYTTFHYYCQDDYCKFKEEFNVDVNNYGEFYIDNLRFTVSDDFS